MNTAKELLIADALQENRNGLYRLAYSYVHNPDAALDLVQECAYKALSHADRLRDNNAKPWLYRILINAALDEVRRRGRETPVERLPETPQEDAHAESELKDMLKVLDEKSRAVILLHYFEDMKLTDVAVTLGENLNTVKSRQRRALAALRKQMEGAAAQ